MAIDWLNIGNERTRSILSYGDRRHNKGIGADGEHIARMFLEQQGYVTLSTNFRCTQGEVDLIVRGSDGAIVFVEVKSRYGELHGAAAEAIDARKVERLRRVAANYLATTDPGDEEPHCRFDIIEVHFGRDGLATVHQIRGAF